MRLIENLHIFPNYSKLNFEDPNLNYELIVDLYDFFSVCMENYPFTIHFLINELNIPFLKIYGMLKYKLQNLSDEQIYLLKFNISEIDLAKLINELGLEKMDMYLIQNAYVIDTIKRWQFDKLTTEDNGIYYKKHNHWIVLKTKLDLLNKQIRKLGESIFAEEPFYYFIATNLDYPEVYELKQPEFDFIRNSLNHNFDFEYNNTFINYTKNSSSTFVDFCKKFNIIKN